MDFEIHLEDNLFGLYNDLRLGVYRHSPYKYFQIFDNKKRDIYKAQVRDRVVHQIIYDYLISLYEPEFISDSYASRNNKGQYKAVKAFRYFLKLASSDHSPCFILKCDIRKYFENIDQNFLLNLIAEKVESKEVLHVIKTIIFSYVFSKPGKGVPLGNITSQIFANVYLNILDQYVKNKIKCRFYVRYNDDLIVISKSQKILKLIRSKIVLFAQKELLLDIPLNKTSIRKNAWGVDFLGFTVLPKALLLREKTKGKIYANLDWDNINSYFGILKHCDSHDLKQKFLSMERLGGF